MGVPVGTGQPSSDGHEAPTGSPVSVYLLYDGEDRPLYVGVANNAEARLRAHARERSWWAEVQRWRIEQYPTRRLALAAEAQHIAKLRPRYNAIGNPDALPRAERGHIQRLTVVRDPNVVRRLRLLSRLAKRARDATLRRDELIVQMHDEGASLRAIGAAADLSHVAVLKILRRDS